MAVLKEIKRIAIKKSPSNFNEGSYAAEDTFEEFLQCIKSLPVSSQVRVVNSVEDLFDGIKNLRVFSHGHIAQCALEQICKLSSCCDEAVSHNSTTDVHIRNMNSARMDACSAMREVENHRSSLTSANSQRGAMDLTSPPYAPYQSVGNRSSASDSNQSLAFRHTSSVLHKVEQSPSLGSDSKPLETNSKPEGRTGTSKNLTLTLTENGLRLSKPKVMTLSRQDVLPPNERKERKKDHYASDEKVVRTYRETRKMRQPLNNFSDLQYTAFDPDEFQTDGPNDFTRDLDKGYENYGQAPSDPSANKPKSKKIDLSKLLGSTKPDTPTVPYPLRIQETVPVSMQQNIRNVSIDSMFAKLLDLPLRTYCDNNFSSSDLKRVIKRFIDEESYINIFQPLLEAELEATLQDFISTDGAAARSVSGGQDKIRILGGADVLSARTNVPKIDIRFVGIFDRPSVLAPDGQDVFLQEVKVAILRRSKEVNLVRDDLVILLDSNNVKDFNSIKAILHETYTLGIVTSQGKDQNTPNLDNTVRTQLSMVVLPGRTPPQDVDWVCVPLIGLSTHLREWSALHSIRSHGLMPLTPYILQAAPVVSAHKLRIALSELTEHINSIATVRLSQGERAIMMALSKMKSFNVDFTVLKKTNIIKTLKGLEKMDYLSDSIKKELRSVHKMWKEKCQINNDKYTTGSLQGGNVVEIPSDIKNRPAQLSSMQWEVLKRLHNNSQLCAIKYVVGSADDTQDTRVTLVQGPPGTGKTMTVLGMIAALLHMRGSSGSTGQTSTSSRRNRLLVCAPSNAAVDEILTRLIDKGIADNKGNMITPKIVRLGKPLLGAPAEIEKLTLDNQVEAIVSKSHEWKSLLKASESIMHLQEQLDKLDSGFYAGDKCDARKKLREKLKESKRIKNTITLHITEVRTKARQKILEESDIVASTLSSSGQYVFVDHISQHNLLFETVLVDEAAQATEPATLIPLRYGCKRLVLVGDARQLPAFVCSRQAEVAGLGQSLFERLERCGHEIVMLKEQYRMHPEIRQFPSVQFYGGELTDAECIVEDINNSWKHNTIDSKSGVVCDVVRRGPLNPVMFFNLGGLEEAHRKSYLNRHEADFVLDFLTRMSDHFKEFTIAVITPYKSQVRLINDKIARAGVRHLSVEVNTVDGFQGREKDIVLFSAVRTRRVGFLSDYRRLNVAITRAKKCLVIVGHEPNLRSDTIWSNMIENLRERGYTHCASDVDVFSEFVFNTDTATDDACEDEDEAMEVTVREEEGEITSSTDRHSVQQKKRKRDVND